MHINNNSKILIIAAHPDDEVLAMGGSIAKFKKMGAEITVKFLGEGVSARFSREDIGSQDFIRQTEIRKNGAVNALNYLGVDNVIFGERLCCRFDGLEILDIVKDIEKTIQEHTPTLIFTHNPVEVNIDHRICYRAVETAVRPKISQKIEAVYSFEIVCSGNWTFSEQFKPTTYVDIFNFWTHKLDAWHFYAGEERPFPFPRSDEGLKALAQYRGLQSGMTLAEGFRVLREVF